MTDLTATIARLAAAGLAAPDPDLRLLGEFNQLVNPGNVDSDGWGLLATQMASRIYSRLKI